MMFRRRKASESREENPAFEPEPAEAREQARPEPGRQRWSTAFLVVGSAMAGATALALWNRHTIEDLRAQIESQPAQRPPASPDTDEIV